MTFYVVLFTVGIVDLGSDAIFQRLRLVPSAAKRTRFLLSALWASSGAVVLVLTGDGHGAGVLFGATVVDLILAASHHDDDDTKRRRRRFRKALSERLRKAFAAALPKPASPLPA